ncbi:MAG: hypothetical protein COA45_08195 [Zetaproteobacteria bacterium]|nr:MAG: hypothetical protein COA45_08195 [Zetaproteobacteria bacterium]
MSLSWKDNVVRSFAQKSSVYDQNCIIQQDIAQSLADDLPVSGVESILEIGCGTGNLTQHLFHKYAGKRLCITDVSAEMVSRAKDKCLDEEARWVVMDGECPNVQGKYDLIVANMVFQWFEDIGAAVDRLSGMLNSGGSIFYSMPGPDSFREWKETLDRLGLPLGVLEFHKSSDIYRDEIIMHQYKDAVDFLRSMKTIGAGTARKDYTPLTHTEMKQACGALDQSHGGNMTWHVLYGRIDG